MNSSEELLLKHRGWMDTDAASSLYSRRQEMSEPTFGIRREQMNARRFLLRGMVNVEVEFNLLATAFNLRTLWRILAKLGKLSYGSRIEIPNKLAADGQIGRFFVINLGRPPVFCFAC